MENKSIDTRRVILPCDFVNHWNEQMSDEQYHKVDNFIGSSSAKVALDSLAGFYDLFFLGNKPAETKDQMIGKRVHMALLEPDKFKKKLITMPDFGNMREKKNQLKQADWILDKPKDAVIVKQEDLDQILGIVEALLKHDQGLALIRDGHTEIAGFVRCPITGLGLKFKPDFLSRDRVRFSDFKTTKSSKRDPFMYDVFKTWRYDFQLAYYLYCLKLMENVRPEIISILAAEKKRPYEPAAYYFTKFELEKAESQVTEVLKKIRDAIETNKWPYRQQSIERAKIPRSLQYDEEEDNEQE